jgi:ABC-type nitrate/sulfonate/bicarbonate transport system substrate-binding protein
VQPLNEEEVLMGRRKRKWRDREEREDLTRTWWHIQAFMENPQYMEVLARFGGSLPVGQVSSYHLNDVPSPTHGALTAFLEKHPDLATRAASAFVQKYAGVAAVAAAPEQSVEMLQHQEKRRH